MLLSHSLTLCAICAAPDKARIRGKVMGQKMPQRKGNPGVSDSKTDPATFIVTISMKM